MKIRIFEKEKNDLCLKLFERQNCVELAIVDSYGKPKEGGTLLAIFDDGTLSVFYERNKNIGIILDENGAIKQNK
jgi:hypothetical protein